MRESGTDRVDEQSVLVVIESIKAIQHNLLAFLGGRGYAHVQVPPGDEALESLAHRSFWFTLLDLDPGEVDADGLIRRLRQQHGNPGPIIGLISRNSGRESNQALLTVDALLETPASSEDLDKAIAGVLGGSKRAETQAPEQVPTTLCQEIELWRSAKMREVRDILNEAAGVDVTVLITGETGTGKEVVAHAIHYLSTRRRGPFVKVNCAAVPRELLESELFGHERGAFTGAHKLKIGKFESAHRGTILLDEIGDLHPSLQAKLLHVLQDGDFSRVGGKSTLRIDVRVIAATNQDLERAVLEGRFREDLYYRLNVIQINVPPLRERADEIPGLVQYFVQRYSQMFRRQGFSISRPVMDRLVRHSYRGNVRELENLVKRMIVLGDPLLARTGSYPAIPADGNGEISTTQVANISLKDIGRGASQAAERDAIRKVLMQTGWNRVRAAKALKISYRALLYKMKQGGLREEALSGRSASWRARDQVEGLTA